MTKKSKNSGPSGSAGHQKSDKSGRSKAKSKPDKTKSAEVPALSSPIAGAGTDQEYLDIITYSGRGIFVGCSYRESSGMWRYSIDVAPADHHAVQPMQEDINNVIVFKMAVVRGKAKVENDDVESILDRMTIGEEDFGE